MIFQRRISDRLHRLADTVARLVVWIVFSALCYLVITMVPFDLFKIFASDGLLGAITVVVWMLIAMVMLWLYLYYSARIFRVVSW